MHYGRTSIILSALALALSASGAGGADLQTRPTTTTPSGAYAVARMELSSPLRDAGGRDADLPAAPQTLFIALRDDKLANLWFVRPFAGDSRLTVERSDVALAANRLAGTAHLRTARNRGTPPVDLALKLDLALADGKLTGRYEITAGDGSPYQPVTGTADGTLHTAAAPDAHLAADASWTGFWGTQGDMSAGPQPPLVQDLARARPVWRSETEVLTAYGNAPDNRYFSRAIVSGNGGGGSSPVVAGDTVYVHFYAPSPQSEPAVKGSPFWERAWKDDAEFRAKMAAMKTTEREVGRVLNHFRPLADDHVVALDAATGAERWRTVLPLRSPNLQTHKHRGVSGVPLVHGDTLYVPNLMSRLYALDRTTGAVKWERPAFVPPAKPPAVAPPTNPSPMMAGGCLVFATGSWHNGTVYGLDPATGAERWKAPGAYLLRWERGGGERLIALTGLEKVTLSCIDPASGKTAWQQEVPLQAKAPLSAAVVGDLLIAASPAPRGELNAARYEGWRLSDGGATRIWQDASALPADENMAITVTGGRVYLLGKQVIRVLDVASGKQVAERNFEQHGPGSNAWLGIVGDRLLFCPEGQHGVARLTFLDKNNLADLCPLWLPPHVETTAYNSQPIVYPVVDGRLFVRGGDGVYCYDLRERQPRQ